MKTHVLDPWLVCAGSILGGQRFLWEYGIDGDDRGGCFWKTGREGRDGLVAAPRNYASRHEMNEEIREDVFRAL